MHDLYRCAHCGAGYNDWIALLRCDHRRAIPPTARPVPVVVPQCDERGPLNVQHVACGERLLRKWFGAQA